MLFRRKTRPSDVSNKEHVSGKVITTKRRSDGYTYCEAVDGAVIRGLKGRGFVQCVGPVQPPVTKPKPEPKTGPSLAKRLLVEPEGTLVQQVKAGWLDAVLEELLEEELAGQEREVVVEALFARSNLLVDAEG